jgi:hypothetical protein
MARLNLNAQGRALVERLGGHWHGHYGLCRCPAHDDRTPSLRIAVGDKTLLVHCFAGCERISILRALHALDAGKAFSSDPIATGAERRSRTTIWQALRIWYTARPLAGTPADVYLRRRAIVARPACIRFHGSLRISNGAYAVSRPGMVVAIETDEGVVAVQRTFLTPDGRKAPIPSPRRGLGSPGIGAVRLAAPDEWGRLGLAEGTETALSASELHDIPVWATVGAENFGRLAIPERVRELHLFLDNGAGGDRAERLLRVRQLPVDRIITHRPPDAFKDWNDVAMAAARSGHEERGTGVGASEPWGRMSEETDRCRLNSSL